MTMEAEVIVTVSKVAGNPVTCTALDIVPLVGPSIGSATPPLAGLPHKAMGRAAAQNTRVMSYAVWL